MSTRSIIALQHGDGFRGRYCHSSGYPTYMGPLLLKEVHAAGVEALEAFLDDDGPGAWGISYLAPGFLTDPVCEGWQDVPVAGNYNHRVYRNRKGEGPTGWMTHDSKLLGGAEWCYTVGRGGVMVGVVMYNLDSGTDRVQPVTFYSFGWTDTPDFSNIEQMVNATI